MWMDLEIVMQSEVSQKEKNKCMDSKGEAGWEELGEWDWPMHTADTIKH